MATILLKNSFGRIVIVVLATACGLLTVFYPNWQNYAQAQGYTDLGVTKVELAQAVFDPDIDNDLHVDLVFGRKAAIFVTLFARNISPGMSAIVEARLGNQVVASHSFEFFGSSKKVVLFFTPQAEGEQDLVITVDPINAIPETNESNNSSLPQRISVRETKQLVIPSVPVDKCQFFGLLCSDYGSLTDFDTHVKESNRFFAATYPVSPTGFSGPTPAPNVFGIIPRVKGTDEKGREGIEKDLADVVVHVKKVDKDSKRGVGVVPEGYFEYHDVDSQRPLCFSCDGKKRCAVGVASPNQPSAVLVQERRWTVAAHEVGHTFKLKDEYRLPINTQTCELAVKGIPVSGYWVEGIQSVDGVLNFMGESPGDSKGLSPSPASWVSNATWEHLFNKLLVSAPDPQLIIVRGIVDKSWAVELLPWYVVDGVPDVLEEGSFALEFVDGADKELAAIPFEISFSLFVNPLEAMSTESSVFAFALPYPQDTAVIRMRAPDGNVVMEVDPVSKVLRDAVDILPDQCFTKNPTQRRNALGNKVEALEKMLQTGNTNGALNKLNNDIRLRIGEWLVDDCARSSLLETSKEEFIDMVDDAIMRVSTR